MMRISRRPFLVAAVAAAVTGCSSVSAPRKPHLELSAEATAGLVTAGTTSELAIRVRVAAGRLPDNARQPLNLVLVLDTSGSMIGDPIVATRAAALRLIERLSPGDRFAVVAFDSGARAIVPSATVNAGTRRKAAKAIGELEARGTTDLAAGLALGLQELARGRRNGTIDRIVLSGDGVPNDASNVPNLIAEARNRRATITTLGLGIDYDEGLLDRLALDTGGEFHFVAEASAVGKVFDDELARMRQVVGRNVRITMRPGPGVTLEAVPGVEVAGPILTAWLGDLGAGEVRDVIIPLSVLGRRDGAVMELADVEVVYDDVVGSPRSETLRGFVGAGASADVAAVEASVKLPLEAARRRAAAASTILDAIRRARAGDVAGGLSLLDEAEKQTRAAAEQLKDDELRALADRMVELRRNLAQVAVVMNEQTMEQQFQSKIETPATAAAAIAGDGSKASEEYRQLEDTRPGGDGAKLLPASSPARAPDDAELTIRAIHDEAVYHTRH